MAGPGPKGSNSGLFLRALFVQLHALTYMKSLFFRPSCETCQRTQSRLCKHNNLSWKLRKEMPVCLVKLQREEFKHDKLMPLCLARFVQKTKACDTQCGFFNSIFLQFFNSKKTRRSKLCNLVLLFKVRLQLRGSSGTTEPETTAQHGTCDFQENADYTIMEAASFCQISVQK